MADTHILLHCEAEIADPERIMFDYQAARLGADQHSLPLAWARRLAGEIAESFRVLARLQYDDPWRKLPPAPVPADR